MRRIAMSARPLPPVLVVLGSTGCGKTKLGVELALRTGGEVINVDAMQLYRGLPIATNQASMEERRGVTHHLLGCLDPLTDRCYTAWDFQKVALPLLTSLRERGTTPVLVGGTMYYLESLLWDFLVPRPDEEEEQADEEWTKMDNAELYATLTTRDPVLALKLHPNDRRKVLNALRWLRTSGRALSEVHAEQHAGESRVSGAPRFPPGEVIAFWVDSNPTALYKRLDRRAEAMLEQGLLQELRQFYQRCSAAEKPMEEGRGLWQSIGFKEFLPCLQLSPEEHGSDKERELLAQGLELLKSATRRYARRQFKWIRSRLLGRTRAHSVYLFRLDTSRPERWAEAVSAKVDRVLAFHRLRSAELAELQCGEEAEFWHGCPVDPEPLRKSASFTPAGRRCETCGGRHFVSEEQWQIHLRSRSHQRRLQSLRKREMAEADRATGKEVKRVRTEEEEEEEVK